VSAAVLRARLDSAIDRAIEQRRIVGTVVLVAHCGELVYRRAAGFADRETQTPMRADSIFLLASVTKPIVTAAAMGLIEDNAMGLEDLVTRWLPDFRPRLTSGMVPAITVRQLLTHTAGLSYRSFEPADSAYHSLNVSDGLDQPGLSLTENLRRLGEAPLVYEPGCAWRYSLATDVLGHAGCTRIKAGRDNLFEHHLRVREVVGENPICIRFLPRGTRAWDCI
jgi:CubicO group peptidase (beta-lactamase class C family)